MKNDEILTSHPSRNLCDFNVSDEADQLMGVRDACALTSTMHSSWHHPSLEALPTISLGLTGLPDPTCNAGRDLRDVLIVPNKSASISRL
jgi:hypothetical protein